FLSLFSLILAVGILVDTGIVITEGMHDHLKAGKQPVEAARAAVTEFQWPLITGTLTTVAAFAPLLLMSGIMGEFVRLIPITIIFVLMGSLFTALVLLPTMVAVLLRHHNELEAKPTFAQRYFRPYIDRLHVWYEKQLRALLPNKKAKRRFVAAM